MSAASASAAERTITLGTAGNFAVLAGTTVANTGTTVITGDLGVSPGTAITGFPLGVVTGATHPNDAAATQAQTDSAAAYTAAGNATTLPCTATIAGNLAGLTLTPGVYCAGAAIGITGTLTLDFQGNPNAFFLFRIGAALTTAAASAVHVINTGAGSETCAPNTFWALNRAAGFGAATNFTGTILANGGVTSGAGTTTTGRILVNGAVTIDSNAVSVCPNPIPPSADLSIGATGSPDPAAPGAYILYPITVTNAGPDSAANAAMTTILPAGLGFGAIAAPPGWSCATPAVGVPGAVTCTAASFATGSANFALTAKADPGIITNTTLSLAFATSSSTIDPDNDELLSSVITHVVIPKTSADLSVGATGAPDPVAPGAYILYPITAVNAGPDSAANATMTAILPAGLGFGAISAPPGWACTTPAVGAPGAVTCVSASFATGSATFALTARADAGIVTNTALSLSVATFSSTIDPDNDSLLSNVITHIVVTLLTPLASTIIANPGAPVASIVATPVRTPARPTTVKLIPRCVSHRRLTVHLSRKEGSQRGTRIAKAILLNAKHQALMTLKSTPTSVDVDLRGLAGQKVTVQITTKTRSGRTTAGVTRTYETCP